VKEGVCCHKTGDGNGTDTSSTTQSTGVRVGKINSQTALDRHGGRRASLAIGNVQPASTCKICRVGGAIEHRLIEKRGSRAPIILPPAAHETTQVSAVYLLAHMNRSATLQDVTALRLVHFIFSFDTRQQAGRYHDNNRE